MNDIRDRTRDGASEWNAVGTSLTFDFGNGLGDYGQFNGTESSNNRPCQKNAIHRQNLSTQGIGAYAFTNRT